MKKYFLFIILFNFTLFVSAQQNKIENLKKQIENATDDTLKVNQLLELSARYKNNSKYDSALLAAYLGLEMARSIGHKKSEVDCEGVIGWTSWNLGDYATSIKFGYAVLNYAKSKNDTVLWLKSSALLSNSYRDHGDFKEALQISRDIMPIVMANGGRAGVRNAAIGSIYFGLEKYDSALYYIEKGLSYPKDFAYGWILMMAGRTMVKLHNEEMAFKYLHQSIQPLIDRPNLKDLTSAYTNLASLYDKTGQIDSAIYYGKQAVYIGKQNSFNKELLEGYMALSLALEKVDKSEALTYYKLAMDLNNNIFSQEKKKQVTAYRFNEILKQNKIKATQLDAKNRLKLNALLGSTFTLVMIAILLFRHSRMKQKAKQKIEKAYDELKSTQSQLIQSEKMASLGELTAGIAHEIQNPLNFVNNFAEVSVELVEEMNEEIEAGNISDVKEIAGDLKQNLEKINHHGQRASGIVKGMLEHSRTSTGKRELTDINVLADEYLRLAYHGLRAKDKSFNADFKTEFDETLPKLNVVSQDIGRVLLNLINNAFYTVDKKAKLGIDGFKPEVKVTTEKVNDKVVIKVWDNGDGIPKDIVDKIFQPFFTTKPTGSGTGLGLSLAYDIVTKGHDGHLEVETEDGMGTMFIVRLPIV